LRFADDAHMRRYPFIVVPRGAIDLPLTAQASARLADYQAHHGRVLADVPAVVTPHCGGIPDATVLVAHDGAAFLDIVNYDVSTHAVPATTIRLPSGAVWNVGPTSVPARDALLLYHPAPTTSADNGSNHHRSAREPLATDMPSPAPLAAGAGDSVASDSTCGPAAAPRERAPSGLVHRTEDDCAHDGFPRITLFNDVVSVTLAPAAGARAFTFRDLRGPFVASVFTSVGALRDDVAIQPPLSTTDRIGKYTRSFPAGFFNRPYTFELAPDTPQTTASATLRYDAPDVVPNGAHVERTITLLPRESGFTVDQRVTFGLGPNADRQRAVRYDSFATVGATLIDDRAQGGVGWYDPGTGRVASASWRPGDVEDAQLIPERTSTVLRLQFSPGGRRRTRYALDPADSLDAARAMMLKERAAVSANPDR
jgi:hypothetical protein